MRDIPPLVMLVVDSSGSMEDLPACTCASATDCTNCVPNCSLLNVFSEPPKDLAGHELKKNRWAVTLEALTGKFKDFQCEALTRTAANGMTYDENYSIPYHQPWKCASGTHCAYPGASIQEENGILDSYKESLRFGLITFDGEYTYKGGSDLINDTNFSDTLSNTMPGMWSYGDRKKVRYPGCPETYYVNSGARGKTATEGALISLNSDNCASPPCDQYELNATIQEALLKTRPYGGTPIAASLDDLYEHLKNEVSTDTFAACRKRYAILITDGAPDPDMRDLRCQCGDEDPMVSCGAGNDPKDFDCPYPLAQTLAKKLVQGDGTAANPKQVEQLFVLGMSVNDAAAKLTLDKIAEAGGTTKALQADDPNTLRTTLDNVFSPLLNPISRSLPAFATGLTGTQYQISSGFQISASTLASNPPPWIGLIERRRFECNSQTGELDSPDLNDEDRLHKVYNSQDPLKRSLWTAVPPTGTPTSAQLNGVMARGSGELCGNTTYCERRELTDGALTAALYGVSTPADRTKVIDWMYGNAGSVRAGRRLGDIYHSSPAVVGPPIDEPVDDAYTRFRARAEVKERPLVMYISTNDGILHALSVEQYPATGYPLTVNANNPLLPIRGGEEFWGFVPPMVVEGLKEQLTAHQFKLDATPVVKDVFYKRGATAEETEYHSVLITGMRGGGRGYVALEVTDPLKPRFLWQYTEKDMGLTYGQPEIVQATFKFSRDGIETATEQTRAIAILPGGVGKKKTASSASADLTACNLFGATKTQRRPGDSPYASWRNNSPTAPDEAAHRVGMQCWERQGRALYFVDVETGQLLKKIYDDDTDTSEIFLPSPISGSPTAYFDAVGSIADRGFVVDADGVIWRIDMSSRDVKKDKTSEGWTMRPFHDIFWDKNATSGETTYERPILSLNESRQLVLIAGTGNTDNFENSSADNRIVSLTEVTPVAEPDRPDQPDEWQALINWELRNEGASGNGLYPSELVSGSMALFEGQLFAASFISDLGGTNSCEFGRGRLWSLHYNEPDVNHPNPATPSGTPKTYSPKRIPVTDDSAGTEDTDATLFNVDKDHAGSNLLIQGLGTTQRISCAVPDADPLNSYFAPGLANIQESQDPAIWVVAQASRGNKRASSKLGSVQAKIKRTTNFSRVTSWATSVD